jgi:hypothetical protein
MFCRAAKTKPSALSTPAIDLGWYCARIRSDSTPVPQPTSAHAAPSGTETQGETRWQLCGSIDRHIAHTDRRIPSCPWVFVHRQLHARNYVLLFQRKKTNSISTTVRLSRVVCSAAVSITGTYVVSPFFCLQNESIHRALAVARALAISSAVYRYARNTRLCCAFGGPPK